MEDKAGLGLLDIESIEHGDTGTFNFTDSSNNVMTQQKRVKSSVFRTLLKTKLGSKLGGHNLPSPSPKKSRSEPPKVTKNIKPDRKLWIDALCINQEDIAERNVQVQRMGNIYQTAKGVLIWLGEASDDCDVAIDALLYISSDKSGIRIQLPLSSRTKAESFLQKMQTK
jgi:hypothetical protein